VNKKIKEKNGILLDIGCGANKQGPEWTGIDMQKLPGVDIVHNFTIMPWPIEDESVLIAMASHILEHIPKVAIDKGVTRFPLIEFMNEVWRVMKPDGRFMLAMPHGASPGFMQDPTHASQINETMFSYFDPLSYDGQLYRFYRPKPWKIHTLDYEYTGNIEVVLIKRRMDVSYG